MREEVQQFRILDLRPEEALQYPMGLRVSDEEETVGLDLALHNERGYNL